MPHSKFLYTTYIRTTPEKLWAALTQPEFQRLYWFGTTMDSDWTPGSSWKMVFEDGRVTDSGEILASEPFKKLVIRWCNDFRPELQAEGYSRCTFEIEPVGESVKLTILHEIDRDGFKFIEAVSGGWPRILSSLKSYLETGAALGTLVVECSSSQSLKNN